MFVVHVGYTLGSHYEKRIMSEKQGSDRVRASQVVASALAAITAALLGSTMGVAGTVIGAGVASVVSTVGGVLYLRSIQRTSESVRFVRSRVIARAGSTTVTVTEQPRDGRQPVAAAGEDKADESDNGTAVVRADGETAGDAADEEAAGGETAGEQAADEQTAGEPARERPAGRRRTWLVMAAGSLVAFALGMAVITGFEWLRGEPLSGGDGTTLSKIIQAPAGDRIEREQTPPPATDETSTPPATGTTGTVAPEPTGEVSEPADPPAQTSTPSQTTPPVTTTGDVPTGSASVPPPSG